MFLKELFKEKKQNMGLAPGALPENADQSTQLKPASIEILDYNEASFSKRNIENSIEAKPYLENNETQTWINFINVSDTVKLKALGEVFKIHPLVLEDITNTQQRPKFEDWDDYIYVVITMLKLNGDQIDQEQVSFVLGPNYLISFQEKEGDVFNTVRTRLENGKGRVRKMSVDYLLYILLDSIIDHYFLVLENINNEVEALEESIEKQVDNEDIVDIQKIKRETLFVRRLITPVKELCQNIIKSESVLLFEQNLIYFKDLQDHVVQAIESLETLRDFIASLLEYCNSFISTKLNEIMKVLTMVSTIFIPITFIAGIYGMNFEHMPELSLAWAYPSIVGLMILIVILMFTYFKRKKWL